ncbi:MAG TPA: beta-galactosidase trimerization domain-containing protein [Armatimonadota bacterium]|jgi:hypothetical protein
MMLRLLPVLCLMVFCLPAAAGASKRLGVRGFERTTFWHVHPGLTDADIAASVNAFVRSGVTGVIIGGGRHHYLHDDLPFLEDQIAVTKRVVKACHAKGIRVCEHHSVVLTARKDYALEHKDWIQRDFETGDFSVWPEYQTYAFCPNNPAFREHYWAIMADIVRRTGVDAVMSDDASFHHGCACQACTDRWRKEEGGDIRAAWKASRTAGTPEWRQWNAVRQRWYTDFRVWLYERMRREMPGVQCFSLLGNLLSPWGPQTSGANQEGMMDTGDASWWEIYNPADFPSWRRISVEAAALYEAGRVRHSDIVSLPYADRAAERDVTDPEEETFMWALSMAHGISFTQARVFLTGITPAEPVRPYWLFERDTLKPYRNARPAAAIGVFFSRRSRDADPRWESLHSAPAVGWAESLQDAGIPYRGIVEETLDAGLPREIRTVILPNAFAVSEAHLDRLERFVREGGTLIVTHQTGFNGEDGSHRVEERWKRLGPLFGVKFGAPGDEKADRPRVGMEPTTATRLAQTPLEAYENRIGKGKVVYLPGLPERDAFQNTVAEGEPYRDPRDPKTVRALADLARALTPGLPVRVEAGKPILVTAWKQKGRLLVHIVNTSGADRPDGEKIPAPSKVTWAPAQDLILKFARPPKRLRLLSLDPSENRTIEDPGATVVIKSPRRYALVVAD